MSVNRAERTFRLRDSERGTVRIRVNRNTRYERIDGLRGLRAGMRRIEATVRRATAAGSRSRSSARAAAASTAATTIAAATTTDRSRRTHRSSDDRSSCTACAAWHCTSPSHAP